MSSSHAIVLTVITLEALGTTAPSLDTKREQSIRAADGVTNGWENRMLEQHIIRSDLYKSCKVVLTSRRGTDDHQPVPLMARIL